MQKVGGIFADFSLQTRQFTQGLRQAAASAKQSAAEMEKSFGQRPQEALEETGKAARRVTWTIRGYIKDTWRVVSGILISQAFYTILRYLRQMISEAFQLKKAFEETAISFTYLLGRGDLAIHVTRRMRYWALETEYSIDQVTKSFRDLFIAGVRVNEIEPVMGIIVNTASAFRMELNDLVSLLTFIRASPVINTSALRQLQRAGIELVPILREQLGLTLEEIDDINKLKIPGEVMFNALLAGFTKFDGAAKEMANTVGAITSDLFEVLRDVVGVLFDAPYQRLRTNLQAILRWVASFREGTMRMGPAFILELFPERLRGIIDVISSSLLAIVNALGKVGTAIRRVALPAIEHIMYVMSLILPLIARLFQWIGDFAKSITQSSPIVRQFGAAIASLMIAGAVIPPLRALVFWLGGVLIARPAALAVRALNLSLIALASNKAALFLVALVAVLAALAMNFKRARDYIQGLSSGLLNMFRAFPHIDYIGDSADGLHAISDGFEAIKEDAEAAADAFKPFLAAFDEVYGIREDSGEDQRIWPDIELPEFKIPEFEFQDITAGVDKIVDDLEDRLDGFFDFFSGWKGALRLSLGAMLLMLGSAIVKFVITTLPGILWGGISKLGVWMTTVAAPFIGKALLLGLKAVGAKLLIFFGTIPGLVLLGLAGIGYVIYRWGDVIVDWFKENLGSRIVGAWDWISERTSAIWSSIVTWFSNHVWSPLSAGWNWLNNVIRAIWGTLGDWFRPIMQDVQTIIAGVWYFLSNYIPEQWEAIRTSFNRIWMEHIAPKFEWISEHVWKPIKESWEIIAQELKITWTRISTYFTQIWEDKIGAGFNALKTTIWDPLVNTWFWIGDRLRDAWQGISNFARDIWTRIGSTIKNAINGIIDYINRMIEGWNNIEFKMPGVKLPDFMGGQEIGGWTVGTRDINTIPRLAEGAIITKDTLYRGAEKGPEAVLPLTGPHAESFARTLAGYIAQFSPQAQTAGGPPVYVGTLIADERSLRELERKMRVIRLEEDNRMGGSH